MPGVTPRYSRDAALTYTVGTHVVGGDVVEVTTGGVIQPASAGSTTVVGVATKNGRPTFTAEGTTGEGDFLLDASGPPNEVAVERGYFKVSFVSSATVGQKLIAAVSTTNGVTGGVAPAGATPDARTIIGECAEAAGVSAGALGLARIY